jgi:uncharacterized protein (DUF885 family)
MRFLPFALLALVLCLSLRSAVSDDTAKLHKLFADDYAWQMHEFPESATFAGYPGQNDRWTDWSPAAIEARRAHPKENLQILDSINPTKLNEEDRLNYDLFRWRTQREIEGLSFPSDYLQIDPLGGGVHSEVPSVLEVSPARTLKDYEDALKRLQSVPKLVDQKIALLREGLAKGVTQPKIVLRDIPGQVDRILEAAPAQSVLFKIFQQFPDSISVADQDRLRRAAAAQVDGAVYPAFRKFRDFLTKKYIPGSRESIALSSLPNGSAWYRYKTLQMTTTHLTPQEIHEIGQREVKRIRAEMDKTIASTGFHGSFDEFVAFLRTDPRFYYTRADDLVTGYRDICKRVDAELPRLFGKLPRTPYGVKEIDAYRAPSETTAFYEPGPVDGSRSGTYRVNTYKLEARPKFEMEVLSLHESVPGHHLQIALAHELDNVPEFRKQLEPTAFVEGWGLYSESLGYEIGLYKGPYSKFGQLSYDMWRACRLVVDTGMHALGWTRQQAIDFMKANTALTEQNIVVEVDRYISWPGQATAYKIGQLKIRELRTMAEQKLGPKFDERQFHDLVLSAGAIPLDVLEKRVQDWLEVRVSRR